jgi:5-methylcytosine-specific restriction endonuclease McrA
MRRRYEIVQPGEPFDPAIYKLGAPCKRNHLWDEGVTLRIVKNRNCPQCQLINALERKSRLMAADPEVFKTRQREATYRYRAKHGRKSRSKHGLPYTPVADVETKAMRNAIRQSGRLPSVAKLVYDQQQEHWQKHLAEYKEHCRARSLRQYHWRYMTDKSFRLYHRNKSKKRKAQERGSRTVMLSPDQLWRRWVEFDHRCAYCGADGDMQVEHVIPISKGGEHHLGNIVPACQRCNYSKRSASAEQWYKGQPFFCDAKWEAIQATLAKSRPTTEQLAMPLLALTGPSWPKLGGSSKTARFG